MNLLYVAVLAVGLLPSDCVVEDSVPVMEIARMCPESENMYEEYTKFIFRDENGMIIQSFFQYWRDPADRDFWTQPEVQIEGNVITIYRDEHVFRKIRVGVIVEKMFLTPLDPETREQSDVMPNRYRKGLSPVKPVKKDWKYWENQVDHWHANWDLWD